MAMAETMLMLRLSYAILRALCLVKNMSYIIYSKLVREYLRFYIYIYVTIITCLQFKYC